MNATLNDNTALGNARQEGVMELCCFSGYLLHRSDLRTDNTVKANLTYYSGERISDPVSVVNGAILAAAL